jgi:hypothetical protein
MDRLLNAMLSGEYVVGDAKALHSSKRSGLKADVWPSI